MSVSDIVKKLILKISEGDSGAFGSFYDMYFQQVFQFSRYFIKSEHICQEVVSDVFFKIWQNRKKLSEIESMEAYLYTLTKNKSLDHLDAVSRKPSFADDIPLGILANDSNPEELMINQELEKVINIAIEDLPERCKLIFLMAKEQGLKYSEIAQILSISEKTINAQMVTALKKMGSAVKKYYQSR
ncbi:MAG TPA: RNA polymerase sigma-70 factor [Bacteroidales bacterium]|nr:RNA polymerase sigma-70 factor [Bacteroidales bacterium]